MIAAGFEQPVPREVGRLVISVEDWDFTDPTRDGKISKTLETHVCTDQELGLAESDGDMPQLYPLAKGYDSSWLSGN